MQHKLLLLGMLLRVLTVTATPVMAAVSVKEIDQGGGVVHVQVKNEYFDAEFAPEKGAQALNFKTCYSPNEWVFPGYGGLFKDNFVGQGFPGELPYAKHKCQILERGPEKVVLEFQTVTKDNLVIFKRMTFAGDSPVVRVAYGMINQGTQSVVRGLWPKWDIYISGIRENNRYFRPDCRGINESGWNDKTKYMGGEDFVKNPYAGWLAAVNTQTSEGLVWLMDYHWLKWLYNCNSAWTIEWFYDYAPVPKGGKWETEYDMILVKGFPGFCHASTSIIAGMTLGPAKPDDASSDLVITHYLGRSMAGDIRNAKMTAKLRGVDSKEEQALPALDIGDLKWEPRRSVQTVKMNMNQRLVCGVELTGTGTDGKAIKEEYSFYWPGIKGEAFSLLAGTTATTYYRKPPRKVKTYAKPRDLVYFRKPEGRMLEFRGLFHQYFQVPEAATRAGLSEVKGSYFSAISFAGNSLSYVPSTYEEMFQYDLVVLNNVDASSLTDFGLEVLREYVQAGGNVLVLGGQYAFGAGGYQDTQLAEVLPVVLGTEVFDMKALKPPAPLKAAVSAKVLKKVSFKTAAHCFWIQELTPKPDAWVELTAGDVPFLICGPCGKGKVAVIAGNVCGASSKDTKGFWETAEWVEYLSQVIHWMVFE